MGPPRGHLTPERDANQQSIAAGGEVDCGEIVTATTATTQTEFAPRLTDIVGHPTDAEAQRGDRDSGEDHSGELRDDRLVRDGGDRPGARSAA
jgi:hypothetical protein